MADQLSDKHPTDLCSQDDISQPTDGTSPIFKVGPIPTGVNESIEVCVWARQTQHDNREVTLFYVTLQASYRDGEEWKRSASFKPHQIPVAMYALQKAFDYIVSRKDRSQPAF